MNTNNRHHSSTPRAFTLIELLVVITIIGILVGIAVPVGNRVLENTRKVKVQATIKDLQVAIKGYQTEYNRFPVKQAGGQDANIATDDSTSLISVLMGENEDDLNPREIVFIELPIAKNGAGGLTGDEGAYSLTDGWGEPFQVTLDTDYDNRIANPDVQNDDSTISGDAPARLPMGVAIYSKGKDKKEGTQDDVVSWR
jgi:prepilin-type N-terminal cleavage/methylation domain-containing protein